MKRSFALSKTLFALTVGFAAVVGCSNSSSDPKTCTAGVFIFCRCKSGSTGSKQCNADGKTFGACAPCGDQDTETPPVDNGLGGPGDGDGNTDPGQTEPDPVGEKDGGGGGPDTTKPEDGGSRKPPTPSDAGSLTFRDGGSGSKPEKDAGGGAPNKNDAGVDASIPPAPGAPAPNCTPLKNTAPKVEIADVPDEPPQAGGGKISDGTYIQTWVVHYTGVKGKGGPTGTHGQQTLEITGSTGRLVFAEEHLPNSAGGFLYSVSGDKMIVSYQCPTGSKRTYSFDASPNELVIYDGQWARYFVRQP